MCDQRQSEERAISVDDPSDRRRRYPDQPAELTHRRVRPAVPRHKQNPTLQTKRPRPPPPGRVQPTATHSGHRLDQTVELTRAKPREHLDKFTTLSRDHLHAQSNATSNQQLRDNV